MFKIVLVASLILTGCCTNTRTSLTDDECRSIVMNNAFFVSAHDACNISGYDIDFIKASNYCRNQLSPEEYIDSLISGKRAFDSRYDKYGRIVLCDKILTQFPRIFKR